MNGMVMGLEVVRFGYQSTHPLHRCVTSYFVSLGLTFPFYKMWELDQTEMRHSDILQYIV